jgi:glycine oxidase
MSRAYDIIVIGNGIVGMSLALALAKASASTRIAIVGPHARTGSASLAAGAMINVWAETEADCLENPALAARFFLARKAFDLWDEYAGALAEDYSQPIPISWGTYVISGSRGPIMEERAFDYMRQLLKGANLLCEDLSARDLCFLSPDTMTRPMRATRIPDGAVDSGCVMAALETVLQHHPACNLIPALAKQLVITPSGDKIVRLHEGNDLHSKTVVLANGAYAQALIDQIPKLKNSVPSLLFGGGSALHLTFPSTVHIPTELRKLNQVVRTMDRGGGCGMHLIPRGDGGFYFGASSGIWLTPEHLPRVHAISVLLNGLTTEFHHNFFHASLALQSPGFRPVTLDAFPLLGESDVRGVWFCNGTKRDGFTCAPFLAQEMVKSMAGLDSELPEMFRPSRPLISYWERERAIDAAVESVIGSEYMHGLRLPTYRHDEWFKNRRKAVTAIYERRQIKDFGIHPELTHFYESDELYRLTAHRRDQL